PPASVPKTHVKPMITEGGTGIIKTKNAEEFYTFQTYGLPREKRGVASGSLPGSQLLFGIPVKHMRVKNLETARQLYISFVGEISAATTSTTTADGAALLVQPGEEREFANAQGVTEMWLISDNAGGSAYRVTYEC